MNSAEILREAAYEEGYKAGKRAMVEQIFKDLESKLSLNKITPIGITAYAGGLKYDIDDLRKKYEVT